MVKISAMADAAHPPIRAQTIGEVLDGAFRIFQRTIVRTLPISVLAVLIGQAPNVYLLMRGLPVRDPLRSADPGWLAVMTVTSVLICVAHYAMLRRQFAIIHDRPTRLGTDLTGALVRTPAILALLIVQILAFIIGAVALILPALYLMVPFAVAWPVIALEERGAIDSCKRALRLTRGSWWRVATIATVAFIVLVVFALVAMIFLGLMIQLGRGSDDLELLLAASRTTLLAVAALLTPFYSAAAIAIYLDLIAREQARESSSRLSGVSVPANAASQGQPG